MNQYDITFFAPISFVIFLISLTFPTSPNPDQVATFNMWLSTLFEVLPLRQESRQILEVALKELEFHPDKHPIRTRKAAVEFSFHVHRLVLKQPLEICHTLKMFAKLRATDCKSKLTTQAKETSCTLNASQAEAFVCAIYNTQQKEEVDAPLPVFFMDPSIRHALDDAEENKHDEDCWQDALENEHAFCSCVFSAKWFMLHLIATGFPETPTARDRYAYHTFLSLFGKLLACFACRLNFQHNMELVQYNTQTDLNSNADFCMLIYKLHDVVNAMLAKNSSSSVSLEEVSSFFKLLATNEKKTFSCVLITKETETPARFYFSPE